MRQPIGGRSKGARVTPARCGSDNAGGSDVPLGRGSKRNAANNAPQYTPQEVAQQKEES
ncbi:hypothetical protein [Paraburkholderia fungorum]|uniref:hypothetical protein n=1 Tax=Paraburkholderia fungorum TaxID=134537 RepID=UPI0038BA6FC8